MVNNMPPPIVGGARLLAYASADDTIIYTNKSLLYVDGKLLGYVPNLAICESLEDAEILLQFCDEHWDPLGVAAFATVDEARGRAESEYHGITNKWIDARVSKEAAKRYLDELYKDVRCSFCGRTPPQTRSIFASSTARICDQCVTDLFHDLQTHNE